MASTYTSHPFSPLQSAPSSSQSPQLKPSPSQLRPRSKSSQFRTLSKSQSFYSSVRSASYSDARPSSSSGISSLIDMGFYFADKERPSQKVAEPNDAPIECALPTRPPLGHKSSSGNHSRFKGVLGMKKKKSFGSLLSLASDDIVLSRPSSSRSSRFASPYEERSGWSTPEPPVIVIGPSSFEEEEEDNQSDKFVERNSWLRRNNTTLHPYQLDAPYMQSYDPVLLDNDRYTQSLLRRLSPGSPTFYDYGKAPPATVLDLGCGAGHWAAEAAIAWRSFGTRITGFDLIDLATAIWEEEKVTDIVTLVRGNFVKYDLPFPDRSFDLVRMANLSLCIPYDKWEFVLGEVHRVLTVGGRLELIDDQIFFPYGEAPCPQIASSLPGTPPTVASHLPSVKIASSSFDIDEEDEGEGFYTSPSTPILEPEPLPDELKPLDSIPEEYKLPPRSASLAIPPRRESLPPPCQTWERLAAQSKELETVFEDMLNKHLGVHPRPSEFLSSALAHAFGARGVSKLKSMHLKLAPRDVIHSTSEWSDRDCDKASMWSADSGYGSAPHGSPNIPQTKKSWKTIEWDKKEKKSERKEKDATLSTSERSSSENFVSPQLPETVSAKAAGRLGIVYNSPTPVYTSPRLSESSSSTSSIRSPISTQSPGLILWPSTFFPMTPSELEMHTCKNLHMLLGCKPAIAEYVDTLKDESGSRIVSEAEFNNTIWDYECFRRQRFNWPSNMPDCRMEHSVYADGLMSAIPKSSSFYTPSPSVDLSAHTRTSSSSLESTRSSPPYGRDELTHVRTIRVYHATKLAPRPPASAPATSSHAALPRSMPSA